MQRHQQNQHLILLPLSNKIATAGIGIDSEIIKIKAVIIIEFYALLVSIPQVLEDENYYTNKKKWQ